MHIYSAKPVAKPAPRPLWHLGAGPRLNAHEVLQFTQQVEALLRAGMTLPDAVRIYRQGQQRPVAVRLLTALERDLGNGSTVAAALAALPTSFDPLYLRLISAGETSGTLEQTFGRLSDLLLRKQQLQQKTRTALMHPTAIAAVACAVCALLLVKVVPEFQQLFGHFGRTLPSLTLGVIRLSDYLIDYGLWSGALAISAGYGLRIATRRFEYLRSLLHQVMLKLPIVGTIATCSCVARFARTMATGYAAGLPIGEALGHAATAPGNIVFAQACGLAQTAIDQGVDLTSALGNTTAFPDLLIHMIGVGEQAGTLETMLLQAAAYYEARFDHAIDRLIPLLEPVMMVALGGLIGALMLAMYLPLFQMGSVLG